MAQINIEQDGVGTWIKVDGVPLRSVVAAKVTFEPNSLPAVDLQLASFGGGIDLEDGKVLVSGLDAPEELERALLAHLQAKYQAAGREMLRLPVVLGVDKASGPDMAAGGVIGGGLRWCGREGLELHYYSTDLQAAADHMEAVRAMVKRHGGGSGG